jgi:hypothetical protein
MRSCVGATPVCSKAERPSHKGLEYTKNSIETKRDLLKGRTMRLGKMQVAVLIMLVAPEISEADDNWRRRTSS